MDIQFLGQGYEPLSENAVGHHLIRLLKNKKFHSFTAISAFISQAGINGLSDSIDKAKKHFKSITFIIGIDQKGTPKEALEALIQLDVQAYVFYQPAITIFHPKIYLFEGKKESILIIGSSNLTAQGLFNNMEASVLIKVNHQKKEQTTVITQLKDYYKVLFDLTDPNLKRLNQSLINDLVQTNIFPTEEENKTLKNSGKQVVNSKTESVIYKIFPKRVIAKIPSFFRKKRPFSAPKKKNERALPPIPISNTTSILVWESGPLTRRDLSIPTGKNTHPTGSMLFKKGQRKDIDQRHFFREKIFAALHWQADVKPKLAHLERAVATFNIIIQGENKGNFELKLTHNTKTNTKTYQQKNAMTSISWGDAKKMIATDTLIGKTVKLYTIKGKGHYFELVFG